MLLRVVARSGLGLVDGTVTRQVGVRDWEIGRLGDGEMGRRCVGFGFGWGKICGRVCGVWCAVCGVWCVVCGVWCVDGKGRERELEWEWKWEWGIGVG
jgi:hypothetical protein